ncbi:hypothetical protein T484DRAFT_1894608, partial [Baffinella frigidus]
MAPLALSPRAGPAEGGTMVYISGTNIPETSDAVCRFGRNFAGVPAETVGVGRVSFDGGAGVFHNVEGTFTFEASSKVEEVASEVEGEGGVMVWIFPTVGPASGNVIVSVHGSFHTRSRCFLNRSLALPTAFISPT